MKPYYDHGGITIYNADARDVLPTLDPVDLVLTDPPYGIGKAAWDDAFPTWWFDEAARLAPAMGLMPGISNLVGLPTNIGRLKYRWVLAAHLVNGMAHGAIGYGNWIPCVVYAAEGTKVFVADADIKDIVIGTYEKPDHPSPKPLAVMKWLVRRLPGQTILDPFMGAGTTLRAAKDEGRKCIGIEIEERYCEVAVARLAQEVLPFDNVEEEPAPTAFAWGEP
jgi:site-specific DNA-methyltransferase (adenine-specific)